MWHAIRKGAELPNVMLYLRRIAFFLDGVKNAQSQRMRVLPGVQLAKRAPTVARHERMFYRIWHADAHTVPQAGHLLREPGLAFVMRLPVRFQAE